MLGFVHLRIPCSQSILEALALLHSLYSDRSKNHLPVSSSNPCSARLWGAWYSLFVIQFNTPSRVWSTSKILSVICVFLFLLKVMLVPAYSLRLVWRATASRRELRLWQDTHSAVSTAVLAYLGRIYNRLAGLTQLSELAFLSHQGVVLIVYDCVLHLRTSIRFSLNW